jgi:Cu-Zn family superoxide dismutase
VLLISISTRSANRGQLTPKNIWGRSVPPAVADLPVLVVDSQGNATQPVIAPHPTAAEFADAQSMIPAGGDNYSDTPLPLGGGGARIACGIIRWIYVAAKKSSQTRSI